MASLDGLQSKLSIVPPGSPTAYLIAAAIVAAATLLRFSLDRWVVGLPFITFFPAIMATTFVCGNRAGSAAVVASLLAGWYFFLPPQFTLRLTGTPQLANLILFVMVSAAEVAIIGLLRTALSNMRDSHALEAAIFDANPDAIVVVDQAGLVVRANERAAAVFGYSSTALPGQAIETLLPDYVPGERARHGRRQDGSEFPVDVQIGPIEGGREVRMIVNIRDVTLQKEAEAALAESRRQQAILEERQRGAEALRQANDMLTRIIESAPTAIYAIDADDRATLWNPAAEQIYGTPASAVIGRQWREVATGVDPADPLSPGALIDLAREQGGFQNVEVRRVASDGISRELSISAALLRDTRGQLTGILFVARDVGEAKILEQRLRRAQKMEAIGQLTGGIAHDFNNLLAIILGNLELLAGDLALRPPTSELLDDAVRAAERGASLTHRLLAYSRLQQLIPSAVDVGSLVTGLIGMLRRVVEESIKIETDIAPGLWTSRIDAHQLEDALLNLAVNARDAMPDGGTLRIAVGNALLGEDDGRAHPDVAPGRYILLSVTDSGSGMTKDVVERAFEPFFTTKPVGRGTGLGLSMVYGFVKQSGGHLSIHSEPGLGTTMKLYLPELRDAATVAPIGRGGPAALEIGEPVILVVEDDPSVLALQLRVLGSLACRTLEAEDGPSALAVLRAAPRVDLLLTDIVLPGGMSGPALAEAARGVRPDLKVVFMSGYAPAAVTQRYGLSGAQILAKPFTRLTLARAVSEALGRGFEAEPSRSF